MIGKILIRCSVASVAMQILLSSALAVDTMTDWTGQNNTQPTTPPGTYAQDNNYGLISPTSVGGQIQSKINFHSPQQFPPENTIDTAFVYFSDPTLVGGTLDFTTPLSMSGTVTINNQEPTEPNLLFGWYSSVNTAHRIGLGISNRTVAQGGAINGRLRVDFGYAATGGNRFHYVSPDGATVNTDVNSTVPNGTYPFTFSYTPGNFGSPGGGSMSATVGSFFKTVTPLETEPEDLDLFTFDRFGLLQRSTANVTQLGKYNITFSNVTYTGGTAAPVTDADFDNDGDKDGQDFLIWQRGNGTTGAGATNAVGNTDGDADVDGDDLANWETAFGTATAAANPVPEPASVALALLGGLAVVGFARRRQSV